MGQMIAAKVSSFLTDGADSVVAFVVGAGSNSGSLVRFTSGSSTAVAISGAFVNFAVDGSGSLWALDSKNSLWLFAPGASTGQVTASGVLTFLMDAAGSVVAYQSPSGAATATLLRFAPGSSRPLPIAGVFKHLGMDGSGSLIALDTGGNLERFAPGSTTPQMMLSGVVSFTVDGAGFVVAEAHFPLGLAVDELVQFAPGSNGGRGFAYGVVQYALDGTGSIVALNGYGELDSYAPGSIQARPMDGCLLTGYDVSVVAWGDGSGVPTTGKSLVIVGTDPYGEFHIRIFDASGNVRLDTIEYELPPSVSGAIKALKSQLPPPGVLTPDEEVFLLGKIVPIVGSFLVVTAFAVDGAGQVVAVEGDGTLVRLTA
ncbi:hypothetical protein ACYOEI_11905, partial [Singulisphaera rosea]